jgi:hypothetical protein
MEVYFIGGICSFRAFVGVLTLEDMSIFRVKLGASLPLRILYPTSLIMASQQLIACVTRRLVRGTRKWCMISFIEEAAMQILRIPTS